jgi:tRNA(fMet)-specific endonuclease VapC
MRGFGELADLHEETRHIDSLIAAEFSEIDPDRFGILQSHHHERYEQWLTRNLPTIELAPILPDVADIYARIRLHLRSRGTPIPPNDMWIAAFTCHRRLPILSNEAHFDLVPNLTRIPFVI